MRGGPGERGGPPGPEDFHIIGPDGTPEHPVEITAEITAGAPSSGPHDNPSSRPGPPGGQRWIVLAVVAALTFALGIAVGHHLGRSGADNADSPSAPTYSGHATVTTPASGMTSSSGASPLGPSATAPGPEQQLGDGPSGPAQWTAFTAQPAQPFAEAPGPCGSPSYIAQVGYTTRLPQPVDVTILVGSHPHRLDLRSGTLGPAIVDVPDDRVVTDIALDHGDLVIADRACTDLMSAAVARVDADGTAHPVSLPDGLLALGELLTVDGRVWAVLHSPDADATGVRRVTLLAADSTGDTRQLPAGFNVTGSWRNLLVGSLDPIHSQGTVAVYDVTQHDRPHVISDSAREFVVGDGFVLWREKCQRHCTIHRYDLSTGEDTTIVSAADSALVGWRAASPDGTRIVGAAIDPNGPAGVSVRVLDLTAGTIGSPPGLRLGAAYPALAFSPDSRWLIVAVPTLIGGRVLLYDRDLHGPYDAGVAIPGPQNGLLPMLLVPNDDAG